MQEHELSDLSSNDFGSQIATGSSRDSYPIQSLLRSKRSPPRRKDLSWELHSNHVEAIHRFALTPPSCSHLQRHGDILERTHRNYNSELQCLLKLSAYEHDAFDCFRAQGHRARLVSSSAQLIPTQCIRAGPRTIIAR